MTVEEPLTPNSNRIPTYHPRIISQEAVNFITDNTYYNVTMTIWAPDIFLAADVSSSHGVANHDLDIEYFSAPVVHPVTGETIYSVLSRYVKLQVIVCNCILI